MSTNVELKKCSVCGQPVEGVLSDGSIHRRPCACALKRISANEEAARELLRKRQIENLKYECFGDFFNHFTKYTFDNSEQTSQLRKLKKYIDADKIPSGILLVGLAHTGKTHAMLCCANAALSKCMSTRYISAVEFTNNIVGMYSEARNVYLSKLYSPSLLLLDGITLVRNTSTAKSALYELLEHRFNSGKSIIISSRLSLSQLAESPVIEDTQIAELLLTNVLCLTFSTDFSTVAREKKLSESKLV